MTALDSRPFPRVCAAASAAAPPHPVASLAQAADEKSPALTDGILPAAQSGKLMDICWNVEQAPSADVIARNGAVAA